MTYENQANPLALPDGNSDVLSKASAHFMLDRWEVLNLVKAIAKPIGLGEREITVLSAHLSVLAKGPVRSDRVLISYAGLPSLLKRANCMDERRFRRGEAKLEAVGLIHRKFSANARRYPVRDGKGCVIDAYGIDLRPLFARYQELVRLKVQIDADLAEKKALKSKISARLSDARRAFESSRGDAPDWLINLCQTVRNVLRRAAVTMTELRALQKQVIDALHASNEPRLDSTKDTDVPQPLPDTLTVDAGHSDRHSESKRKDNNPDPIDVERLDPRSLWDKCDEIKQCHVTPPKSPREFMERIYTFGSYLGLSDRTKQRVLSLIGFEKAALLFNDLSKRIHNIRCPEAYVKACLPEWLAKVRIYDRGHKSPDVCHLPV